MPEHHGCYSNRPGDILSPQKVAIIRIDTYKKSYLDAPTGSDSQHS